MGTKQGNAIRTELMERPVLPFHPYLGLPALLAGELYWSWSGSTIITGRLFLLAMLMLLPGLLNAIGSIDNIKKAHGIVYQIRARKSGRRGSVVGAE